MTQLAWLLIGGFVVLFCGVIVAIAIAFKSSEKNVEFAKITDLKKLQDDQLKKEVASSSKKMSQISSIETKTSAQQRETGRKTEKKTELPSSRALKTENVLANPYHPANPLNPLYDNTEKETEKKTEPDYDDYQNGSFFDSDKVNSNLSYGSSGSKSSGYGGSSYDSGSSYDNGSSYDSSSSYGSSSSFDSSSSSSFD